MFKITAERPGYTSSSLFVWLVNCAAREAFAKDAERLRNQLMKHLTAHVSLSQYLGRGDWVKSVLDNMLYPSGYPFNYPHLAEWFEERHKVLRHRNRP
jgi:hypothetical protein